MFKYIRSFFWPVEPDYDAALAAAYKLLGDTEAEKDAAEPPVEAPTQESPYLCYTRTGSVTTATDSFYTIDDKYEFSYDLQLSVGMKVSFTMYRDEGKLKVSEVTILDDWDTQHIGVQSTWCVRSLVCQVTKRKDRNIYVDPGNIRIDLNSVASEFIPLVGDWLEVEAKVEIDENVVDLSGKVLEVERICPVRPHNLEGTVRRWDNNTREGIINRDVFFDGNALEPGYVPMVGDTVVATVIESNQGRYDLRALRVIPEKQRSAKLTLDGTFVPNFQTEKKGVLISGDVSINSKKLNDTYTFKFQIINQTSTTLSVLRVKIASLNPQCKIWEPTVLTNIELKSGLPVTFQGTGTAINMGTTRDLILFVFDDCNIGRYVMVNLQSINTHHNGAVRNGYQQRPLFSSKTKFNNTELVRGRGLSDAPRFVHTRLPDYLVPQDLYNLVVKHEQSSTPQDFIEELGQVRRILHLPLTHNTYENRFHTLLNLEEIHEVLSIRAYNDDCTRFIKRHDFLVLTIDNLAERRPSLMIGDKIIAKDLRLPNAKEYEGFIHKVDAKHVYLKFDERYHQEYKEEDDVSVRVVASRTCFRRMHHAVALVVRKPGQFLFPTKVIEVKPQVSFDYEPYTDEVLPQEDEKEKFSSKTDTKNQLSLQDLKIETSVKSELLLTEPSGAPSGTQRRKNQKTASEPEPRTSPPLPQPKLEWFNKNLNYFQKEAVRNILLGVARPLPYIIFGPPGTGKTVTLVETILQILRLIPHSRLLVAAPSNSAADLIALRLIDSDVLKPGYLVRLVAYRCVTEKRLPTRLVPYCATGDIAREGTRGDSCKVEKDGLTQGANSSVLGRHRITVGTCSALGILFHMHFPPGHFTHVIVDEAAQAVEPEVMIPLSFVNPSSGQIILAGDPLQLGPVISSKGAGAYGFDVTFLDRLVNVFPYVRDPQGLLETGGYDPRLITRLIYNYRSLPQILTLVSDMFYDSQLIATISATESDEAALLVKVKEILPTSKDSGVPAVVFHGVIGDNLQTPDCPSWFNLNEASQIFWWVAELYRMGLQASDIGIISPYVKQVRYIRALLVEAEFDIPKVGTVEEFQGQEFNVILLSTVRSNENFASYDLKYKLGFLSNPRRVNVAISRAQALMIVVGNPHLLSNDPHWRNVLKYCVEKGGYRGCELPD